MNNYGILYQLAKRDFKNRYIGSWLGFLWTIIQPLVMIFVLWFVFSKGFKVGPINGDIPFGAWLAVGMIAWESFTQTLIALTGVFQEYSYLVKKINFNIVALPLVKQFSAVINQVIFLAIVVVIVLISGVPFSWYWFQVFYYFFGLFVLLLGLSWITSSLQVFVRDTVQVISVILQFGFWLTPIVWHFTQIPEKYHFWLRLNPMFYIVEGYRNSFVYGIGFWEDPKYLIYYWSFTLLVLLTGMLLFRKLKPHFADVL